MSTDATTMSEDNHEARSSFHPTSYRLKGGLFPLTVLELAYYDADVFEADLKTQTNQAPAFFQQAPTVISFEDFNGNDGDIPLPELINLCHIHGVLPIAIKGGSELIRQRAEEFGLALMAESKSKNTTSDITEPKADNTVTAIKAGTDGDSAQQHATPDTLNNTAHSSQSAENQMRDLSQQSQESDLLTSDSLTPDTNKTSHLITEPVRSGQQVYASGGDLIIMAPVSAGAEILADGNIHVYGALRGRALAGVKGDINARVFCQSLEAELISIAGNFKLDEDLQGTYWKKPAQIYLDNQSLCITSLFSKPRP